MRLEPGQTIDRYTVDRLLGQGGMAVVYRVTHNQLGSFHALKVLTVTNAGIRERLLQEGRVQASLRHPNVVTVTDVIDVDGNPGLVMEYIDGPSLDGWLQTHRPSLDEAERLFRGIVAGVAAAHEQGLVHRDLKPANVMLAPASGGSFVPKVADFGLAKALLADEGGLHRTRSGVTMGTPAYMAPEQIRDAKNVDHRADVFSLGCILYELSCGRPPFSGPDVLSIFNAVASGSYPPPHSVAPGLPQRVQDTIAAALRTERDDRIDSCASLLDLLDGKMGAATLVDGGAVSKATYDPDAVDKALSPLDASLTPPEVSGGPKRRFRALRWPGRRKASASSPPTRLQRWFVPLFVAPLLVLGVLSVVAIMLWNAVAARWDATARAALAERTGGEIAYGDSWVRPWGVTLDDVVVMGSDGEPLAEVARVRLRGGWGPRRGFEPRDVRIDGAVFHPRRVGEDWVLPERTVALLKSRAGKGSSLTIRRLTMGPSRIEATAPSGSLEGFVQYVALRDVVLLPNEGRAWTASGFEVGHVKVDKGAPILSLGSAKLEDGAMVVDAAEVWMWVRRDGLLDLPPLVAESAPDWLGGTDVVGEDDEWFGLRTGLWPVDASRLEVRSGALHVYDPAHAASPQDWELALERVTVGPMVDGWLPVDLVAGVDETRFTLEGDVRKDGMVRGRLGLRHLALARFAPYLDESLRRLKVEPTGGRLGGFLDFTLKGDSFAGRLEGAAEEVTFGPAYGGSATSAAATSLAGPRERVAISQEIAGSLADPDFRPMDQAIWAISTALLAPAAREGDLVPPRPITSAGPRIPRAEPTPGTPAPSGPIDPQRALRGLDQFRREVVEVLDDFGKNGGPPRDGDD